MLTCGSVFSGIGLLDYGLTLAGIHHQWLCEADPWRRTILTARWPDARVLDDVRTVGADTVPRVDLIAGGFPCKGASTAGKRNGFDHPETVLWREMARAVGELEPRYVLVENVANILALHDGAVWGEVLGDLAALGYDVVWDCLPAAAVGAPHRRDRVFAVAAHADGGSVEPGRVWRGERGRDQAAVEHAPGEHREARFAEGGPLGRAAGGRALAAAIPAGFGASREGGDASGENRRRGDTAGRGSSTTAHADVAGWPAGWQSERAESERDRNVAHEDAAGALADADEPRADADTACCASRPPAGGRGIAVAWGDYEPAIRRWEAIHGPAPEPLVRRMDDRSAARVERSRLSALGDGVQVQVGYIAGAHIAELERRRLAA